MEKQPKYRVLSLFEKTDVLKRLTKGATARDLSIEFGVSVRTIERIRKDKDKIQGYCDVVQKGNGNWKRKKKMNQIEYTNLDKALYEWFVQKRAIGDVISGNILQEKAIELNKDSGKLVDNYYWCFNQKFVF